MKNNSIWFNNFSNNKDFNNFEKETDILIIGGGIAGLMCAYFLKNTKYKITLVDKSKLKMGVTSKTTAKINYLQETIYQTLLHNFNFKTAKLYYESQKEAIDSIIKIIKEENIECNLDNVSSLIFTNQNKNIKKIKEEKKILESFKVKVEDFSNEKIKHGIMVNDTYVFNPLKFLDAIIDLLIGKISISENTLVKKIYKQNNSYNIITTKGNIKAKYVIVACHYPFFVIPSLIPIKTYIKREYINAALIKDNPKITAINIDKNLYSIRYYNNYVIYGSNSHKLTNKINYGKNYEKSQKDFYKQ